MAALNKTNIQRLWLDARCASLTSKQYQERTETFLVSFLGSWTSRKAEQFRVVFGNGSDLAAFLCKGYASLVRQLSSREASFSISESECSFLNLLLKALQLMVDDTDIRSSEASLLVSTYESIGSNNVVALSHILHSLILRYAEKSKMGNVLGAALLASDELVLRLVLTILSGRKKDLIRRSIAESVLPEHIYSVASTSVTFFDHPHPLGAHVVELSRQVLQLQLTFAPNSDAARGIVGKLEDSLLSSKCPSALTPEEAHCAIASFTCLLESLLSIKSNIGFAVAETISFDVVAANTLNLERAVSNEDGHLYFKRIVCCLRVLALALRAEDLPVREVSSSAGLRDSFLRLMPATFEKVQQRILDSFSGADRQTDARGVTCCGAVDCLARIFVLGNNDALVKMCGDQLFELLSLSGVPLPLLGFVLSICGESFASLSPEKASTVLRFVNGLPYTGAVYGFLQSIVQCLKEGQLRSGDLRIHVLDFFTSWCINSSDHITVALTLHVVQACVCCMQRLLLQPVEEQLERFAEHFCVLAKVIVNSSSTALSLGRDRCCDALLSVVIDALQCHQLHAATLLRDVFICFVVRTDRFYEVLLERIATETNSTTWTSKTTPLLSTLVALLHTSRKQQRNTLPHNAIDLCLSLAQQVGTCSTNAKIDTYLLGCCLSIVLGLVNYSDVWNLFEGTIGVLEPSQSTNQLLLNLCCGVMRSSASIALAERFFADGGLGDFSLASAIADSVTFGPFCVPRAPFCELIYPINVLARHVDSMLTNNDALGNDAMNALEYLLLQSGVTVPNEFLSALVQQRHKIAWLPCLVTVADPKLVSFFFSDNNSLRQISMAQEAWIAALRPCREGENAHYGCYIHLGEGGGAAGVLPCNGDTWPSTEGYTTSMWVRYDPMRCADRDEGPKVLLWLLEWMVMGKRYATSLLVNRQKGCCIFCCEYGGETTALDIPLLPPRVWLHVVTHHSRGKLFASQLKMYINGVKVVSCACPYPRGTVQTAAVLAAPLPVLVSHELRVSIGSSETIQNRFVSLRFIGFELYNCSLSPEQVVSLYALGPYPKTIMWDSTGRQELHLRTPYLNEVVVRSVGAYHRLDALHTLVREDRVLLAAPPLSKLVSIHVSAMTEVDAPFPYLHNKRWALVNTGGISDGCMALYGYYIPFGKDRVSNVDALLCHGGMYQWLWWMRRIEELAADSMSPNDALQQIAYNLLLVLGMANKQTGLLPSSWRRFTAQLTEHVVHHPRIYLWDVRCLDLLLQLCVAPATADGSTAAETASLLVYTTPLEHIFFNWQVLSGLPDASWDRFTRRLHELLSPQNVFSTLNAARLVTADFVNGFLFGLFREYISTPRLMAALECFKALLLTGVGTSELLSSALSACSLSVHDSKSEHTVGYHLGSKLADVASDQIILVRNLLLKCLNEVADIARCDHHHISFLVAISRVMPLWWCRKMWCSGSHAVSVVLSLRLFVLCFISSKEFREGCSLEDCEALAKALQPHVHQHELLEVLMRGYMGELWSITASSPASSISKSSNWTGSKEMEGLLVIIVHLIRQQCQVLLRGDPVLSAVETVNAYFVNVAAKGHKAATGLLRVPAARWRRYFCVIRICRWMRQSRSGGQSTRPSFPPLLRHPSAKVVLKASIRNVLGWLTHGYQISKSLRTALYRSSRVTNLIELMVWPALAALRPMGTDVLASDTVESRTFEPSVETPVEIDTTAANSELEEEEEEGSNNGEDGDDDEWEVLPAVVSTEIRSFGIDPVAPASGMEEVYDACRSFFLIHARERITNSDVLAVAGSHARMTKFVLSLHRLLAAESSGIGSRMEDLRAAFLCSTWMKAAEQSCDFYTGSIAPIVLRNVRSLSKYALDRLVSGRAISPVDTVGYFQFLLYRFNDDTSVVKEELTAVFEWFLYITSAAFYQLSPAKVESVLDIVFSCRLVLLAAPMPTNSLLVVVVARLLELTHCLLCSAEDVDGAALKKLEEVWTIFIRANSGSKSLPALFSCSASGDLWSGGFNHLLTPGSSSEQFSTWLRQNHTNLWQLLQHTTVEFTFGTAEGGKYLTTLKKTKSAAAADETRKNLCIHASEERWDQAARSTLDTATCVDRAVLSRRIVTFPNCCVLGCRLTMEREEYTREWYLHTSGAVGMCEAYVGESVDDLACEPLNHYIRYAPPICLPLCSSLPTPLSSRGQLKPNALAVLSRIVCCSSEESIDFISNAYFVVGAESHICTVAATQKELLVITSSEITKAGDFFIRHMRLHTAAQKSNTRASFLQQAVRRFIPGSDDRGSDTSTDAAFRFSQYYRQLKTESEKGSAAFVLRVPLGNIFGVHQRLFQHFSVGLELHLASGEHLFLALLDDELSFSRAVRDRLFAHFANSTSSVMPAISALSMNEKLNNLGVWTRRWARRECSNFEYLMALNDAASRTVAEIGQYPVMPWVLREYKGSTIDLLDPLVYRDLSRPIGALNPTKARQLQQRYATWISTDNGADPPFHHGTHYSSAAIVLYYLIRLQPYTSRSIRFQGGKLDIADRLFHSVPEAWANSSGLSTGDVKELIPEFFRVADFLRNRNGVPLGVRSDGTVMGDVVLPKWARGDEFLFIYMNALSLESDIVSAQLNQWIDLIYGFKQSGPAAVEAINVFSPLSYKEGVERAINRATTEEDRKSIVASAENFGQTPPQLFLKEAHPRRLPGSQGCSFQDHIIENIQQSMCYEAEEVQCVGGRGPVVEIMSLDDGIYACVQWNQVSLSKPYHYACYDTAADCIRCAPLKGSRASAVVSNIKAAGCGAVRCLRVAQNGNAIFVGTDTGKVLVYGRGSCVDSFFIMAVLHSTVHPCLQNAGAVRNLYQWDGGTLLVTYEAGPAVSAWQLSCFSTMFAFAAVLLCGKDDTPIVGISRDGHTRLYYAATANSIAIFTPGGVELLTKHMAELIATPRLNAMGASFTYPITSTCYVALSSFSLLNLFVIGQSNGTVSFFIVTAANTLNENFDSTSSLFSFRLLHAMDFAHAVTCIQSGADPENGLLIGLANGEVHVIQFPPLETNSP